MKQSIGYQGREVFIVDGTRTPFLKARGPVGPFSATDLGVHAGRQLLKRYDFAPDALDEVIVGCVGPRETEANIARVIALRLGCGHKVPAFTVSRNCASGMQSIDSAAKNIAMGRADLILAGGTEAMSHSPIIANNDYVNWMASLATSRSAMDKLKALAGFRPSMLKPIISLEAGLTDPVVGVNMGQTAQNLAERFNITRQQMDQYAVHSHQRLTHAQENKLITELVPIIAENGKCYDHDDGVRSDSSVEKLAKLKPYFDRKYGDITPGNSSQITDGSAMLLLASETAVKEHNLPVLGRIVDCNWAALDPAMMGLGPVCAATPLLMRQQLTMDKIDYWEINEAFAAQVLACSAAWQDKSFCTDYFESDKTYGELDMDKLNVDGGAIACGHPVGTSGARIVLHLLRVLERNNAKTGMASICIGGGQGGAMLVERVGG